MEPMCVRTLRTARWPAEKSEEERGRIIRFEGREVCVVGEMREGRKRKEGGGGFVPMVDSWR
jgi:hypothetical protein